MDPPCLLAHLREAPGVGLGGGEVQVRELGDRVANLLVDRALGDLAAVQMRDGKRQRERRDGRAQHLESVAEHDDDVRIVTRERCRKRGDSAPDRLRDCRRRIGIEQHLDTLGDRPTVGLDHPYGLTEARRQVRARDKEEELKVAGRANLGEHGTEVSVVRARDGHDADPSRHRVDSITRGHRGRVA